MAKAQKAAAISDSQLVDICKSMERMGFYLLNPETGHYFHDRRGALYKTDQETQGAIPTEPRYGQVMKVASHRVTREIGDNPSLLDLMRKLLNNESVPDLDKLVGYTFVNDDSLNAMTTANYMKFAVYTAVKNPGK